MATNDCVSKLSYIVAGKTVKRDGRITEFHRTFSPVDNTDDAIYKGALEMIFKHPNYFQFVGCSLMIYTPEKDIEVIFKNYFNRYSLQSLDNKVLAYKDT